ncbi:MAG TPA: hypothetical protein VEZ44_15765 [bacterium]|nr:hypothetical protein [bacterium]
MLYRLIALLCTLIVAATGSAWTLLTLDEEPDDERRGDPSR